MQFRQHRDTHPARTALQERRRHDEAVAAARGTHRKTDAVDAAAPHAPPTSVGACGATMFCRSPSHHAIGRKTFRHARNPIA